METSPPRSPSPIAPPPAGRGGGPPSQGLQNLGVDLDRLVAFQERGTATGEGGLVERFEGAVEEQAQRGGAAVELGALPDGLRPQLAQQGCVGGVQAGCCLAVRRRGCSSSRSTFGDIGEDL